jgi:5-methylcytosine-specific restriction protein A
MRPWQGSTRLFRLPKDWQRRRQAVIRRDGGRCRSCGAPGARDVDHVLAGDNHDLANLQLLCRRCHLAKSAREGSTAAAAARTRHPSYRRPPEPHPGTIHHPRRPAMTSTEPIDPDVEEVPEPGTDDDSGDQGGEDGDEDAEPYGA